MSVWSTQAESLLNQLKAAVRRLSRETSINPLIRVEKYISLKRSAYLYFSKQRLFFVPIALVRFSSVLRIFLHSVVPAKWITRYEPHIHSLKNFLSLYEFRICCALWKTRELESLIGFHVNLGLFTLWWIIEASNCVTYRSTNFITR